MSQVIDSHALDLDSDIGRSWAPSLVAIMQRLVQESGQANALSWLLL
jgi:hypothetical protein